MRPSCHHAFAARCSRASQRKSGYRTSSLWTSPGLAKLTADNPYFGPARPSTPFAGIRFSL
jgi:hypothetical protein